EAAFWFVAISMFVSGAVRFFARRGNPRAAQPRRTAGDRRCVTRPSPASDGVQFPSGWLRSCCSRPPRSAMSSQHRAAQHGQHMPGMSHADHGMDGDAIPEELREGGQSAFEAIQKIVEQLMADPETDWSRVDN